MPKPLQALSRWIRDAGHTRTAGTIPLDQGSGRYADCRHYPVGSGKWAIRGLQALSRWIRDAGHTRTAGTIPLDQGCGPYADCRHYPLESGKRPCAPALQRSAVAAPSPQPPNITILIRTYTIATFAHIDAQRFFRVDTGVWVIKAAIPRCCY